jgi:hypothetical protein
MSLCWVSFPRDERQNKNVFKSLKFFHEICCLNLKLELLEVEKEEVY